MLEVEILFLATPCTGMLRHLFGLQSWCSCTKDDEIVPAIVSMDKKPKDDEKRTFMMLLLLSLLQLELSGYRKPSTMNCVL